MQIISLVKLCLPQEYQVVVRLLVCISLSMALAVSFLYIKENIDSRALDAKSFQNSIQSVEIHL